MVLCKPHFLCAILGTEIFEESGSATAEQKQEEVLPPWSLSPGNSPTKGRAVEKELVLMEYFPSLTHIVPGQRQRAVVLSASCATAASVGPPQHPVEFLSMCSGFTFIVISCFQWIYSP